MRRVSMGILLLALLATASALSVERCEVRNIDVEEGGNQIPLAGFHCYTDADLYVQTPVNASLAPILLTSTAREVKDHLSGTSDTTNGKLNFAGDWFPCPCRTAEQMPPPVSTTFQQARCNPHPLDDRGNGSRRPRTAALCICHRKASMHRISPLTGPSRSQLCSRWGKDSKLSLHGRQLQAPVRRRGPSAGAALILRNPRKSGLWLQRSSTDTRLALFCFGRGRNTTTLWISCTRWLHTGTASRRYLTVTESARSVELAFAALHPTAPRCRCPHPACLLVCVCVCVCACAYNLLWVPHNREMPRWVRGMA